MILTLYVKARLYLIPMHVFNYIQRIFRLVYIVFSLLVIIDTIIVQNDLEKGKGKDRS